MAKTELSASVSGTVWKIEKSAGDSVNAGDEIMILESMKMEVPVVASCSGKLATIDVAENDVVSEGQTVATIDE